MLIKTLPVGQLETNCYVVTNEDTLRCVVIDPGDESNTILDYMESNHLKCEAVLMTHGHFDHIGALCAVAEETGADSYMNEKDTMINNGILRRGVELPEGRCRALETLFSQAGDREGQLIYNTLDAMVSPLGIRWPVRGAYTCLEFAGEVLQKRYPSIRALDEALHDRLIFEGDFKHLCSQCTQEGDAYFTKRGFWGGMGDTLVHFGHLISRVIHPKRYKALEIRENERIR